MDIRELAKDLRAEAARLEAQIAALRRAADALDPPGTDRMARARMAKAAKAAQRRQQAA